MKELVKYHNDFNKLSLSNFGELEQNLLFGMLVKVKDNKECFFSANELRSFVSDKNLTKEELLNYAKSLGDKFFKLDFTIIKKKDNLIEESRFNLFKIYKITCDDDNKKELKSVEIVVNEIFAYLVEQLTANFTRFELYEFIALSGKYTKTLYRLLKQYRHSGWTEFEFGEFKRILDIPEDYEMCNIDQSILKPSVKRLSKYFNSLKYTKIKKGGNKVTAIRFDWEIPLEKELECKKKDSEVDKAISGTCVRESNLQAYCGIDLNVETKGGFIEGRITNVYEIDKKIIMEITSKSLEVTNFTFENLDELEKCVDTFKV